MAEVKERKSSRYGLFALGVVATSVVGIGVVTSSFILPAFRKVCRNSTDDKLIFYFDYSVG